jgi:hypothetical protein
MGIAYNPAIVYPNDLLLYVDATNTIIPRIGDTTLTANGGVSGPSGGYYTFDGTDDGYSINNSVYNQTYTGKTVIVAARMSTLFGSPNIFRAMIGTNASVSLRNFNFYIFRDGTGFRFHFSTGNGVANSGTFSSYLNVSLDQWFIGAVSQNSSNLVSYYLNGIPSGTATQTFAQFNTGTTEYLGRADNFWNGDIAYWMVYKRALTAQEIQQNYNATKSRYI